MLVCLNHTFTCFTWLPLHVLFPLNIKDHDSHEILSVGSQKPVTPNSSFPLLQWAHGRIWNFQFWSSDVFLKDCVWCFSERMFYYCASTSPKPTFHYRFFAVPIYESSLFWWNYLSLKPLTAISVFFTGLYFFIMKCLAPTKLYS